MLLPNDADPEDTLSLAVPTMLTPTVSEEETIENEADGLDSSEATEDDYMPTTQEHISSDYDSDEDKKDISTSVHISTPPAPSHRFYRSCLTGTL